MTEIVQPTTTGAANIWGGTGGATAYLLSRRNLLTNVTFTPDLTGWVVGGGGTLQRTFTPENVFGRWAADIEDASAAQWAQFTQFQRTKGGGPDQRTFVATCWLRALDDLDGVELQLVSDQAPTAESKTTGDVVVDEGDWTFIVLVASFTASADATGLNWRLYPAAKNAADVGRAYVVAPRLYELRETLTGFENLVLPRWRWGRFYNSGGGANVYGVTTQGHWAIVPRIEMANLVASPTQIGNDHAILNHDGAILFQPSDDEPIFYVVPQDSTYALGWTGGKAIGHESSYELVGQEPIPGVIDCDLHHETETSKVTGTTNYVVRVVGGAARYPVGHVDSVDTP